MRGRRWAGEVGGGGGLEGEVVVCVGGGEGGEREVGQRIQRNEGGGRLGKGC